MDPPPGEKPQETASHRPTGAGWAWYLWGPLACVLYVLSAGPVARYYQGRNVPKSVEVLYSPIVALAGIFPPVGHFLEWYIQHLWAPPAAVPASPTNAPAVPRRATLLFDNLKGDEAPRVSGSAGTLLPALLPLYLRPHTHTRTGTAQSCDPRVAGVPEGLSLGVPAACSMQTLTRGIVVNRS